ncbi:MAG: hypothetical protein ACXACC_06485 [Promethearchaeota archaeon]
MPYIERKVNIYTSRNRIFDILNNTLNLPKWNLVVNGVAQLTPEKFFVKTTIGDMMSTRLETKIDEKITISLEGGPMEKMGYKLSAEENNTEVIIWADFHNEEDREKLDLLGDLFLKSLKKYAEYLQAGGNPNTYKK